MVTPIAEGAGNPAAALPLRTDAFSADGDVVVVDIEALWRCSPDAGPEAKFLEAAHEPGISGASFWPRELHHIDLFTVHRVGQSLSVDPDRDTCWCVVEFPFEQKPLVERRRSVAAVRHFTATLARRR